jgi:hypothetical protein
MLLLRKREVEEEEEEQGADAVGDTGVPDTPIATDIPANAAIQAITSSALQVTAGSRFASESTA